MKIIVHQRAKSDVAKSKKGKKSDVAKPKKGKKSKAESAAAASAASTKGVDLPNGWLEKLLALRPLDLANVIATLVREGKIPLSLVDKGPPSFSSARWDEVAPSLGLGDDLTLANFHLYKICVVLLPPSFHGATTKAAWRIQDVY
jgi:hypothetical protein